MAKLHRFFNILVVLGLGIILTACAATQKHESTGQYVDDSVITSKVKAKIFDDTTLKTLQINVKTFKGVVQLSGFVDTPQSVTTAGQVATMVEGVKSVENDLIVK
jgi:osmotically-inducible protein OsmY